MQSIIIFIRKHKNFNLSIWVNGVKINLSTAKSTHHGQADNCSDIHWDSTDTT